MVDKWWFTTVESAKETPKEHQQKYIRILWKRNQTKQSKRGKFWALLLTHSPKAIHSWSVGQHHYFSRVLQSTNPKTIIVMPFN